MATKKSAAKKAAPKKKLPTLSTQQKVGIGVGLTAAAVAAAGAYFLYGSEKAAKNRGKVKSWMLKAKAEVLDTLEAAEEMTSEEYDRLIDSVSGAYSRLKDASKVDIATFKKEMKAHWAGIEKIANVKKKVVKKETKKPATKKTPVAKKAVVKTKKVAEKKG